MTNETIIQQEISTALEKSIMTLAPLEKGKTLVITTPEQFILANQANSMLKTMRKNVDEQLDGEIKELYKKYKQVGDRKKAILEPIVERELLITNACKAWQLAEDKRRREEEAAARAEKARQEKEAQDAILAAAVKSEADGDTQGATDLLEQAETYQAPVYIPAADQKPTKVFTEQGKTTWKPEPKVTLINPFEFATAVVAGKYNPELIKIELRALPAKKHFMDKGITEFEGDGLKVELDFSQRRETY